MIKSGPTRRAIHVAQLLADRHRGQDWLKHITVEGNTVRLHVISRALVPNLNLVCTPVNGVAIIVDDGQRERARARMPPSDLCPGMPKVYC